MTHFDMSQSVKSYFRARRYDPFPAWRCLPTCPCRESWMQISLLNLRLNFKSSCTAVVKFTSGLKHGRKKAGFSFSSFQVANNKKKKRRAAKTMLVMHNMGSAKTVEINPLNYVCWQLRSCKCKSILLFPTRPRAKPPTSIWLLVLAVGAQ